jgi:ubiquinone/menaquinone biosynthesis C-methylase UbiE
MRRVLEFVMFDDSVDAWDAYTQSPYGQLRRQLILRNLSDYCPANAGKRVLDAGGGVGDTAMELARRGCKVTLLDVSGEMLSLARKKAVDVEPDNLVLVKGDIVDGESLFTHESFDVILAHSLLEFTGAPVRILELLVRLLAPRGILSVVFGNRFHYVYRYAIHDSNPGRALQALEGKAPVGGVDLFGLPRRTFNPDDVQDMMNEVGLRIVRRYGLRTFTDLAGNNSFDPAEWLELEAWAGSNPALWPSARFIQMIGIK